MAGFCLQYSQDYAAFFGVFLYLIGFVGNLDFYRVA